MSSAAVTKKAPGTGATSGSSSGGSHPPYSQMIVKAIGELNEKGGSSRAAIIKYISQKYTVSDNVNNLVRKGLIKLLDNKEIVHTSPKSTGANGSFKLASNMKSSAGAAKNRVTSASPTKKVGKSTERGKSTSPSKKVEAAASPAKKALISPKKGKKASSVSPKKPVAKKATKKF